MEIIGTTGEPRGRFESCCKRWYSQIWHGELASLMDDSRFDLIIPVSARSVRTVALHPTEKKVLPPWPAIEACLDKRRTLDLCRSLGIPAPDTVCPSSLDELRSHQFSYPCVVKGVWEAGKNVVAYASNFGELERAFERMSGDATQANTPPLIQEYVSGVGAGFFAFYQSGRLKRWYIHQRIREYPATGGRSTAARTFYHPEICEHGTRIL